MEYQRLNIEAYLLKHPNDFFFLKGMSVERIEGTYPLSDLYRVSQAMGIGNDENDLPSKGVAQAIKDNL